MRCQLHTFFKASGKLRSGLHCNHINPDRQRTPHLSKMYTLQSTTRLCKNIRHLQRLGCLVMCLLTPVPRYLHCMYYPSSKCSSFAEMTDPHHNCQSQLTSTFQFLILQLSFPLTLMRLQTVDLFLRRKAQPLLVSTREIMSESAYLFICCQFELSVSASSSNPTSSDHTKAKSQSNRQEIM